MDENEQIKTNEQPNEAQPEQAQPEQVQQSVAQLLDSDSKEKILAELQRFSKKQVKWHRLSTLCFMGILLVVIVVLFIMIPKVTKTLDHINSVATRVETSLDGIDTMVSEMTTASKNLNKLVDENSGELTEAVEKMANVDYDGLNQAIQDLQDAIGPMATFFNKFR